MADSSLTGEKCAYCGKPLDESDSWDIVYCEICGTPVHRECRKEKGVCPNLALHSADYCWHSKAELEAEKLSRELKERLREQDSDDCIYNADNPYVINNPYDVEGELLRRKKEMDEPNCMGVSERELVHFMNVKTPQDANRAAIMKIMAITGRKMTFNIFHGFLKPFYQFYRGMNFVGLLLLAATFVLALPQIILYLGMYNGTDAETLSALAASMNGVSMIMSYVSIALTIIMCLFGDYLFLLHAVKKIKKIREQYKGRPQDEYHEALASAGTPRWSRVFIALLLEMLLVMLTMSVVGLPSA